MRFNQQMATVSKRAWAEKYVSLIKTVQVEGVKSSLDDHFDNILNVLFLHARRNGSLLLTQAWMTWQRLFYEIDVFWEKVAGSVRPLGAACRRRKAGSAFHIWARHTRRINALSEAVHRHEAALRHVRVQLLRMLSGDNYRSTSNVQLAFACWVRKWKEVTWQEKHADVQTARMYSVLSAFAKGHTVRVKSRMMSSWGQWKSVAMYKAHHSRTQQEISALLSWEHKRSAARSLVEFRCRIKRAVWHKWCLQHVRMVSAEALQATKQKSAEALQATKQKAAMSRIKATIFACFRDGTHYSRAALISRWASWKEFVVGERLQNERMAKALRSMVNCRRSMLRKAWQKWEAYDGKGARDALLRRVKGVLARRLQAIEDGHGTGVRLAWMRWKHANAARGDAMRASEERMRRTLETFARNRRGRIAPLMVRLAIATWQYFTAKSREEEAFDINVLNQRTFDAELHEIDRRIAPLARSLAVYQRRFIATTIRTSVQARLRESFSRWLRRALRSNARPTSAASQQERSPPPVKESPQRQQHLHLRRLISRRISMPMPLPESLL